MIEQYVILSIKEYVIVNDITNFCFRFLPKPYTGAFAGPKTKFLMSLTIVMSMIIFEVRNGSRRTLKRVPEMMDTPDSRPQSFGYDRIPYR